MSALMSREAELQGVLARNESLARYTSFQAGGCAELFYKPKDLDDVCFFLAQLDQDIPVTWLGLGSNTLVRDGGIRGAVICTRNVLSEISQNGNSDIVAQAGVSCAKLSKFSRRKGLKGGEFFAGIPGTVGGALAMNAGAFGGETWNGVIQVELLDRLGQIHRREKEAFSIGYRHVVLPENHWFISAIFHFSSCDSCIADSQVRDLLNQRNQTQPIGIPSFGSVFKNPEGQHAAQLIEACGLKGMKIGGAYVSEKHANFIHNDGHAKVCDAIALMQHIMDQVDRRFSVQLEPEVRILGESG